MGSGLILLVIVGAWLAFFVQLALRSNETTNVLGTVDKFHDAMRVLSRRQAVPRARDAAVPGARTRVPGPGPGLDPGPGTPARVPTIRRTTAVSSSSIASSLGGSAAVSTSGAGDDPAQRRAAAAARRAKLLQCLGGAAVLTLIGSATLSPWWLLPHLLVDLLLVGLVVHLRAIAQARAAAEQRIADAMARERAATDAAQAAARSVEVRRPVPVVRRPVQILVAGVPDRMPPRPRPLTPPVPVPAQAARYEEPKPARRVRGAQGETWSPVPIPVPTYLSAPTAPRRVVDLTRSAVHPQRGPSSAPEVGLHDAAPVEAPVQQQHEQRRAVND